MNGLKIRKKEKSTNLEQVPADCIGGITHYFTCVKDVISLMMTSKFFNNALKNPNVFSCFNVLFRLLDERKIKEKLYYVHRLEIRKEREMFIEEKLEKGQTKEDSYLYYKEVSLERFMKTPNFLHFFPNIIEFTIDGVQCVEPVNRMKVYSFLADLPERYMKTLVLSYVPFDGKCLEYLPNLERLTLINGVQKSKKSLYMELYDEDFRFTKKLNHLSLKVFLNITSRGIKIALSHGNLRSLKFNKCDSVRLFENWSKGDEALLANVRSLYVKLMSLHLQGFKTFTQFAKNISSLSLIYIENISEELISSVNAKNLKKLVFCEHGNTTFTDNLSCFSRFTNLEVLYLNGDCMNDDGDMANFLVDLKSLKVISVGVYFVYHDEYFIEMENLEVLKIWNGDISKLTDHAFNHKEKLRELELDFQWFGNALPPFHLTPNIINDLRKLQRIYLSVSVRTAFFNETLIEMCKKRGIELFSKCCHCHEDENANEMTLFRCKVCGFDSFLSCNMVKKCSDCGGKYCGIFSSCKGAMSCRGCAKNFCKECAIQLKLCTKSYYGKALCKSCVVTCEKCDEIVIEIDDL